MHGCMHIYLHVNIYMKTNMHEYLCACIHACKLVGKHEFLSVCPLDMHESPCMYECMHACMYVSVHAHMSMHLYKCIHICMNADIHICCMYVD